MVIFNAVNCSRIFHKFNFEIALQLVKENQVHSCNDENDNMLKMMVQGGQLELGEISRIVVDLFLAAADTVSLIAGGIFIFN